MPHLLGNLIQSSNLAFSPNASLSETGAKDVQTFSPIGNPDKSLGKPGQESNSTIKRMLSKKQSMTASPNPAKPDIEKHAHPYYSRLTMMILNGDFEAAKNYVNTEEGAAEAITMNTDKSNTVLWAVACGEPEMLEEILWPKLLPAPNKSRLTEDKKKKHMAYFVDRAKERRTGLQKLLREEIPSSHTG